MDPALLCKANGSFPLFGAVVDYARQRGVSLDPCGPGLSEDQKEDLVRWTDAMTQEQKEKMYVLARVHHVHFPHHFKQTGHNLALPIGVETARAEERPRLSLRLDASVPPDLQALLHAYACLIMAPHPAPAPTKQ